MGIIRPSRRKLIGSLGLVLAAPYIRRADAAMFLGSVYTVGSDPLLKPTGTQTISPSNPFYTGLLYYAFDTGLGYYQLVIDCAPGHAMYPPTLYGASPLVGGPSATNPTGSPPVTTTAFGTAFNWPGISADSGQSVGVSSWIWDSDLIRDSQNLYSQGTGAAVTIGVWFRQTAVNANVPLLFGRTARGFTEAAPTASLCISMDGALKPRTYFYQNGAGDASVLTSPNDVSLNTWTAAFVTAKNDSAGSATVILTVNGVEVATVSGIALADTLGQENNEGQMMVGADWHVYANHVFNTMAGQVFAGAQWSRFLTLGERQTLTTTPWTVFS